MATISSSLKQRGQEILGLTRNTKPPKSRSNDDTSQNPGARPTGVDYSPPNRHENGLTPAETKDIDRLLAGEAETATGEDKPVVRPRPNLGTPLPATEWVDPVGASVARPVPAPPPAATSTSSSAQTTTAANQDPTPAEPVPSSSHPAQPPQANRGAGTQTGTQQTVRVRAIELEGGPPAIQLSPEEEDELLNRQDIQQKFVRLDKAIDTEYERILQDNVSVNREITDWCQSLLSKARVIVTYRQVGQLPRAEWLVEQVRARLDRAEESSRDKTWPILILAWGVAWFAIFIYLVFHPLRMENFNDSFINPTVFSQALFFGGIGGVTAIFYHLFKYVRDRSFDSKYILSYFGKPFMGMILGCMIYLTVFVAMRILGLTPIGLTGENADNVAGMLYPALLFFLALAVGFKENLAFNLLNRVVKAVLGDDGSQKDSQGNATLEA